MEDYDAKDGEYGMYVRSIEGNVACCRVISESGERSDLEVPVGDLEEACGEVCPGVIMDMTYRDGGFVFRRVERAEITRGELSEMLAKYEKIYGDV